MRKKVFWVNVSDNYYNIKVRFTFIAVLIVMCAFVLKANPAHLNAQDPKFQDLAKAELELIKLFIENDTSADEKLQRLIMSNPSSMDYPFQNLQEVTGCISVIESSDRKVRIYRRDYTWEHPGEVYNIFQYKSDGGVFSRINIWLRAFSCNFMVDVSVKNIQTLTVGGQSYYLIFAGKYTQGSDISEFGVTSFTIENNLLQTVPLFNIQEKMLPNLFVCADISNDCVLERSYTLNYNENDKILYVPEADDEGILSGLWLKYQLKGDHFENIGKSGPYYLHESIRDYEYFISEFDSKTYHHRIDAMDIENNKFRLTLWKNGNTINTKPLFVVEGKYNMDDNSYTFQANESLYKYHTINNGLYFIIETNQVESLIEIIDNDSYIDEGCEYIIDKYF